MLYSAELTWQGEKAKQMENEHQLAINRMAGHLSVYSPWNRYDGEQVGPR